MNPTGLTIWGNATENAVSPQPDFPNQDADRQGAFSFTRTGEVVQDNNTGLMWSASQPAMRWADLAAYAAQSRIGGATDWRIPTIKELETITNFGRINPAVDPEIFPDTEGQGVYWTSTADAAEPNYSAWVVNFMDGAAGKHAKYNLHPVRLVRGNQLKPSYAFAGDVVTDAPNGLMWKRAHEMVDPSQSNDWDTRVNAMTWQEALQRAVNDRTGGYSDWRLPTIRELRFWVDETRDRPAVDPIFLPPPFQAWFWSSTPYIRYKGNQNQTWMLNAAAGSDGPMVRYERWWARLVRTMAPGEIVVPAPMPTTPTPVVTLPPPVVNPSPVVVNPTPVGDYITRAEFEVWRQRVRAAL